MSVSRRVVIQGLGAATVGLAVAPIPGSAAARPLPSFAAVGDIHPIEHFQRLRETLIENDALFGPRQVIPAVQEQLASIQRLRSKSSGTDQRELTRVQAQYTQFHSALRMSTGENDLAESCVDRALGLSQLAEDRELTAYFLACKAQLAGDTEVAVDAIGAADRAIRMSAPRSRVTTAAATFAGHGHALNGDHGAMERSYDQARDQLATSDNDPDCPCRMWYLDDNRIALQRARSLTTLGDYHRAAQSYQADLAKIPSRFRRGRGVWLARASRAFAGDHQIEHAATLGSQALALGTETCSARTLTELAHLNDELAPWRTVPAVADFRSAMQRTLIRQA